MILVYIKSSNIYIYYMSKLDIAAINRAREEAGLKPISYVLCNICKETNKHWTSKCPKAFCKTCKNTGHISSVCPNKPIICQYCGIDLNPENNPERTHTSFYDCPNRTYMISKMKVTCLICKKKGHLAYQCNSIIMPKRNYQRKKWNKSKRKKNK